MKIIDITEFFSTRGGGVRSHLEVKGELLRRKGLTQTTLAPGPSEIIGNIRILPGPSLPYDPTYHLLWRIHDIWSILRKEEPDIVEVHSPYVAALSVGWAPRDTFSRHTRKVFFWHSDFIDTYLPRKEGTSLGYRLGRDLGWNYIRKVLSWFDAVIVTSPSQERKLRAEGIERVRLVPFGVEKSIFLPKASAGCDRSPQDPKEGHVLVAMGRMAIEKEWDVIFQAVELLRGSGNRIRLRVLGDGPERGRLEKRYTSSETEFLGFLRDRNEVAHALQSSDLFVHACRYETFGLSVAEAQASGLPVVVPSEGGAFDQLNAASGASFTPGDPQAMAVAIVETLADEAKVERAQTYAHEVRSHEAHFDDTIALYRELLEQR
ncbi:MAG: glycosyltransferase [Polyangiaceae bacterium]|nr:glycosyltransferase [Polyangiaceae bacterium]